MFDTRWLVYCLSRPLERDLAHLVKPCRQPSGSTSSTSLRVSLRPKQTRNENAKVQQLRTSRSPHDLRSVASLLQSSDYIETPRGTNRKKGRMSGTASRDNVVSFSLSLSLSYSNTSMSKAPDKELVPDTPSGTAEQFVDQTDSTVGESLLQHFLHDPNLSPTLNKTEDSHTNSKDSATQSSSDSSNGSKSHPSQTSQLDQQAGRREGARELDEGNAKRGAAGTGRKQRPTSQEGRASESDPAEGPGGSGQVEEGFLGAQTQAQSLDTSWDKRRRLSDNRMRAKTAEEEENLFANGEESVEEGRESVGQSAGAIGNDSRNDEELDQLESSEAEVGGGGSNNRESQKENASSSRPPVPSTSSAPLALRNSHVNLEPSASAPSSSPAVAQQLLQRSPRKKAFAPIPETASSTDPTPSLSHLVTRRHIPQPETNSSPDKGDISDLTFSGPGVSLLFTPCVAKPLLPDVQ